MLKKYKLKTFEREKGWAKCQVIVASAPPSMKKALFTFMDERATEASKVIEEERT